MNDGIMPKHFKDLSDLLQKESDRGCVLVGAAALDDALGNLLEKFFIENVKIVRELLEPSGSLGTFSARINLSYLAGLISQEHHATFHQIRKLRNSFAHSHFDTTFNTQSISDQCQNLNRQTIKFDARMVFTLEVAFLFGALEQRIEDQERQIFSSE